MSQRFYYNERNGSQKGPFTREELQLLGARGTLKPKSLVFDIQGQTFDAEELIDFKAIRASQKSGGKSEKPSLTRWLPQIFRCGITAFFVLLAGYFLRQSNFISSEASEVAHLQLAVEYSHLALVAFGFAVVSWFIARPANSPF